MILVTGGAGFIGANFVRTWLADTGEPVLDLDALTYAGNPDNLAPLAGDARHHFVHGDIRDRARVERLLAEHRPRAIVHFAAESHVDRSIAAPAEFLHTNVEGTFVLLEAARGHLATLDDAARAAFRFLHVSTDEVYGALGPDDAPFDEQHPYRPNSPYAASKAASDHLARAWHRTYGLPVIVTHCSNNFGPLQFPEKLIPLVITRALAGAPLPVYGDGLQRRDWLYVEDHCAALCAVLARGAPGQTYDIGGFDGERSNLEVVRAVCARLDALRPDPAGPHARLITHVTDRPGHDRRYAIDSRKIAAELGWRPAHRFEDALDRTVRWYLENPEWIARVKSGAYRAGPQR